MHYITVHSVLHITHSQERVWESCVSESFTFACCYIAVNGKSTGIIDSKEKTISFSINGKYSTVWQASVAVLKGGLAFIFCFCGGKQIIYCKFH